MNDCIHSCTRQARGGSRVRASHLLEILYGETIDLERDVNDLKHNHSVLLRKSANHPLFTNSIAGPYLLKDVDLELLWPVGEEVLAIFCIWKDLEGKMKSLFNNPKSHTFLFS